MKKGGTVFIAVYLILFLVLGISLTFFGNKTVFGQTDQDNSVSEQLRLGTGNILNLPFDVSLLYGNNQNASLYQEFILLGNNPGTLYNRHNVAISSPDYGFSTTIPTLGVGENFNINSTTDANGLNRYSSVVLLLVPITSPFPPADTSIEDIDPESDIVLSTPIILGKYTDDIGTFVIPQTSSPGYYLLYAYFQYPTYDMTAVYNIAVHVTSSDGGTGP
jgi:hypothetical protein